MISSIKNIVSFHKAIVKFLSGGRVDKIKRRKGRRTLQNVHTHVKLCPPPGRKRVVSYHHSQGTTKLQGQGPGTGGETAVRACSVGTAAFAYCPPAVGADKQHHASRVLKIEGIKKRPGAGTSSGPLCVSKKWLCHFFEKDLMAEGTRFLAK